MYIYAKQGEITMITEKILNKLKVQFTKTNENSFNIPDVGGTIIEETKNLFFVHGNRTIKILKNHPNIKKYIEAYVTGFDEFEDTIKNLKN